MNLTGKSVSGVQDGCLPHWAMWLEKARVWELPEKSWNVWLLPGTKLSCCRITELNKKICWENWICSKAQSVYDCEQPLRRHHNTSLHCWRWPSLQNCWRTAKSVGSESGSGCWRLVLRPPVLYGIHYCSSDALYWRIILYNIIETLSFALLLRHSVDLAINLKWIALVVQQDDTVVAQVNLEIARQMLHQVRGDWKTAHQTAVLVARND